MNSALTVVIFHEISYSKMLATGPVWFSVFVFLMEEFLDL